MGLVQILSRFNKLKQLIANRRTGSPEDLAHELGVSKRQLLNYIKALKKESKDAIVYDRSIQSYIYLEHHQKI